MTFCCHWRIRCGVCISNAPDMSIEKPIQYMFKYMTWKSYLGFISLVPLFSVSFNNSACASRTFFAATAALFLLPDPRLASRLLPIMIRSLAILSTALVAQHSAGKARRNSHASKAVYISKPTITYSWNYITSIDMCSRCHTHNNLSTITTYKSETQFRC